jgi:hypothetical protein
MKRGFKKALAAGVGAACLLSAIPTLASALTNGGFETGNFSGWHTNSEGGGQWQTYSGPGVNGLDAPPQGTFAAETFQTNPSSNVLYRSLRLKEGRHYRLKLRAYYNNGALGGAFATPHSLAVNVIPNQQFRIDLMKPHSGLRSLKASDVLMNLFRTKVGDPASIAPKLISKNVSRFAGRTVRLRLVEVDNQGVFAAGVDAVKLQSG